MSGEVVRLPGRADLEREAVLRHQRQVVAHRRKVREHAVRDVVAGMSLVTAASVWGVLRADLERWKEEDAPDA